MAETGPSHPVLRSFVSALFKLHGAKFRLHGAKSMVVCLKNARWSVTEFGLETVTSDYDPYRIHWSQLLEVDRENFVPVYVCPQRVSAELDVDIEAFFDAWQRALKFHGDVLPKVDPRILRDSLHSARVTTERLKRQRWNEAN
jgi:hypothetical protein